MNLLHRTHSKSSKTASFPRWHQTLRLVARDPYVDWVLMIILTLMCSVGFIILGIHLYAGVNNRLSDTSKNSYPDRRPRLDVKTLSGIIGRFDARIAEQELLLKHPVGSIDPSL